MTAILSSALARYHGAGLVFGAHHSGGFVGKLIQWQTDSDVSHISMLRHDGVLVESLQPKGVQAARRLFDVRERVDLYLLPCGYAARVRAWGLAYHEMGQPYDFLGIARIVTRFRKAPPKRAWFCSELAAAVAAEARHPVLHRKEHHHITPGWFVASPLLLPLGTLAGGEWSPAAHDPVPAVPSLDSGVA